MIIVNFYDVCVCFLNITVRGGWSRGDPVSKSRPRRERNRRSTAKEREKSAELRREGEVPRRYSAWRLDSVHKHVVLSTLIVKL